MAARRKISSPSCPVFVGANSLIFLPQILSFRSCYFALSSFFLLFTLFGTLIFVVYLDALFAFLIAWLFRFLFFIFFLICSIPILLLVLAASFWCVRFIVNLFLIFFVFSCFWFARHFNPSSSLFTVSILCSIDSFASF